MLCACAYFWAGWLGLSLPASHAYISTFWPAMGIALAVLVRWGPGLAPALFASALAINVWAGLPAWLSAAIAAGNIGGPLMAAIWLNRAKLNLRLEQKRDLLMLLGAGSLGATVLSAANGAAWLAIGGRISTLQLPSAALAWWAGDTLGLFVAGIPLLTLNLQGIRQAFGPGRRARSVLLLAGSGLSVLLALSMPASLALPALALLMLPILLLVWLAMRAGVGPASAAVLAMAVVIVSATVAGAGPFVTTPPSGGALLMMAWLGLLTAVVMLTHVQVGELSRLDERWRLALKGSDLGVADWHLAAGTGVTTTRWRSLMGDADEVSDNSLERWLHQVHIDDREPLRAALLAPSLPLGEGLRRELRARVGETWRWFDLHAIVAERDPNGAPVRVVASLADLGPRRDAEERQQLSSSVFMHLHEGLVVTDADMRVLDANPTYCRIVDIPGRSRPGTWPISSSRGMPTMRQ